MGEEGKKRRLKPKKKKKKKGKDKEWGPKFGLRCLNESELLSQLRFDWVNLVTPPPPQKKSFSFFPFSFLFKEKEKIKKDGGKFFEVSKNR